MEQAFPWKNKGIQPGETQTFSVLIGVGDVSSAPELLVNIPSETFGNIVAGGTYAFTGNVSDLDNTSDTEIYYVIDNGSPVKAFTFDGAPGDFNSSITLPGDISLGSHTVSFYAQDIDGAVSPVVNRTLNVVNIYTAAFDVNGGSTINKITGLLHDSLIIAPDIPTKTGFTFDGWYKDTALTQKWNFATDKVTADTTLYAKWIANKVALVDTPIAGNNATKVALVDIPMTGDNTPKDLMSILIVFSICAGAVVVRYKKIKI